MVLARKNLFLYQLALEQQGVRWYPFGQAPEKIRETAKTQLQRLKPDKSFDPAQTQVIIIPPKTSALLIENPEAVAFKPQTVYLVLKPQARVDYFINGCSLPDVSTFLAILEQNSFCNLSGLLLPTKQHVLTYALVSQQPGSTGNINLALFSSSQSQAKLVIKNRHESRKTSGRILVKALATDLAKVKIAGWIEVMKSAPKTNSFLRQDVLLLSKESRAESVPNLEILNHDVHASHSASVGRLSADALYYLRSRGLSETRAAAFLVKGFLKQVLVAIGHPFIQEQFAEQLTRLL